MATWVVNLDFGSGDVDYASSVRLDTLSKRMEIHNQLSPTTNSCEMALVGTSALVADLMAGDADIPITITKDGAAWFKGFVQRIPSVSVTHLIGDIRVTAYDPSIKLKRKLTANYKKLSSNVSTIVGELLTAAGITDQSLSTISKSIDACVYMAGDITYWEAIDQLLKEFGYVLYFDAAGTAKTHYLFPASPASSKTYASGATGNIYDAINLTRSQKRYGGVKVTYNRHETATDAIVFSDTTNAGGLNKCNIDLSTFAHGYPDRADNADVVYCEYAYEPGEIIATDDVTSDVTGGTVSTFTDYGLKAAVRITGAGILTRLDIIAGTLIYKGGLVIKENLISGLTEASEEIHAQYLTADADADILVSGRRAYWEHSGTKYKFRTTDDVTLGAVVTLSDAKLSISQLCFMVAYNEDEDGNRDVELEAIQNYAAAVVTMAEVVTPPPGPKAVDALIDAYEAQTTANAATKTFRQTAAPTIAASRTSSTVAIDGDTWIDSDDSNKVYRAIGFSWVLQSYTIPLDPAAYWSADETPDIPDYAAGITYLQDAWATTDSWGPSAQSSPVASVANGTLILTAGATGTYMIAQRTMSFTGQTMRCRVKSSKASTLRIYYTVGSDVLLQEVAVAADTWQVLGGYNAGTATVVKIMTIFTVAIGDTLTVDWFYVGTAQYTTPLIDNSGNGKHATIYGATPVEGVSGKALSFDGVNDYATFTLPTLTTKLSLSLWISRLRTVSATAMLFETSADSNANAGAVAVFSSADVSRYYVRYTTTTAPAYVRGYFTVPTGFNYVVVVIDTTIAGNTAVQVYLNGVYTALTYDATDATRPSLYNGSAYIGMRGGATIPWWGHVDEPMIFSRALSAAEVLGLYNAKALPSKYSLAKYQFEQDYPPKYLGATTTAPTVTPHKNDWYIKTAATYGIYVFDGYVWAKSAAPTTAQISAAWPDICDAINDGLGAASDYCGTGINFIDVLGANTAFINKLFAQYISINTGGSIKGGDKYTSTGAFNDETALGFYQGADGEFRAGNADFDGDVNLELDLHVESETVDLTVNEARALYYASSTSGYYYAISYKDADEYYLNERTWDGSTWSSASSIGTWMVGGGSPYISGGIRSGSYRYATAAFTDGSPFYYFSILSSNGSTISTTTLFSTAGTPVDCMARFRVVGASIYCFYVVRVASTYGIYYRVLTSGTTWGAEQAVDSIAYSANIGSFDAIEDSDGNIRIAYNNTSTGAVTETVYTTSWGAKSTIVASGVTSSGIKYTLDKYGRTVIMYNDSVGTNLMTRVGSSWETPEPLGSTLPTAQAEILIDGLTTYLATTSASTGYLVRYEIKRERQAGAGIVRSGSNSRGSYKYLSDGTLEQWGTLSNAASLNSADGVYSASSIALTFPVSFISTSYIVNTNCGIAATDYAFSSYFTANTAAAASGMIQSNYNYGTTTRYIKWRAIGRWK